MNQEKANLTDTKANLALAQQILETDRLRYEKGTLLLSDLKNTEYSLQNAENNYLQDRAAMKAGDFTGITGIPTQDMAMWESMGPIADRSEDHLGASDVAIIQFRRQMAAAAKAVAEGKPAIGVAGGARHADLASFEGIISKGTDWRTFTTRGAARSEVTNG